MTTETIGPATTSTRGRHRSARRPNASCDTDADSWNSMASVPAAVSDSPRRGISAGSSGA